MLKEMEMATGGQLYQEKPTVNSMDTIPIRPTINECYLPRIPRVSFEIRMSILLQR